MPNENNQDNTSTENSTFYDHADKKFSQSIQNQDKLAHGVVSDENKDVDPETQVRATEDASLQDDSYSFDEENTAGEEDYEDLGDEDLDFGYGDGYSH